MALGCSLIGVTGEILRALAGATRFIERSSPEIPESHVDVGEFRLLLRPFPKRLQRAFAKWGSASSWEDVQRNLATWQLRRLVEDRAYGRRDFVCPLDASLTRLDYDFFSAYLAEH